MIVDDLGYPSFIDRESNDTLASTNNTKTYVI